MMIASRGAIALMLAFMPIEALAQTAAPLASPLSSSSASDRPEKLSSGATFTIPAAWTAKKTGNIVELTPTENDLDLVLVDVGEAPDAKAAVATAWAAWAPTKSRPPKLVTPRPPRNGWDERQVIDYETSPNEKRVMTAIAFRSGKTWTVAIIDGFEGTAEKRGAAMSLISQSLRPAGYSRESFAGRAAAPMDEARIAELRAFVEDSMKKLGIPGVSFALTDRQHTIYSTGLGVRVLGQPTPVDADSEFAIASNTKGLVTLMLAKLADEGKLRWDEPVTEAYSPFKLGSAETTSKVLIRHLICACTGLPRKDMQVLLNSDPKAAASDAFAQLAATEPTSGFGEVFQYNNLMAAAAGYIGGHLVHPELGLDGAFYRSIDEKVLTPLGMTATTFDFDRVTGGNWARPHADGLDSTPVPIIATGMKLNYAFTRYAGAGGAWSTANDLIKYVRFELNEGKLDNGTQYVSAKNLLQRRVPNVPIGEDQTYGMGLEVDKTWGVTVVHHGGSLGGYKSDIIVVPEAGIGAVLLTNSDNGQMLLRPFMRRLLEIMYGGKPEAANDVASSSTRIRAELAKERERVSVVPDATAVASLAAKYYSSDLGPLTVTKKGNGATFNFRTFSSPVGTRKNDDGTISFVMLDPTLLLFPLVAGSEGGKPSLIVRDSQHEFKYVAIK